MNSSACTHRRCGEPSENEVCLPIGLMVAQVFYREKVLAWLKARCVVVTPQWSSV
ncbi:MAG: hypothetical protein GWO44_12335 [Thermoplasmata archaeon]|nr:hypothetical protein [Thermoplasmata archaeon]NIY04014.1 hypothetical protein [Thermoplasmata archaeon]